MSTTGKWTLTIKSPFTTKPFALNLTDEGNGALTGSILEQGSAEQPQQIQNGTVRGATVYWETFKPLKSEFSGTLNGNTITGDVTTIGNTFPFRATRP